MGIAIKIFKIIRSSLLNLYTFKQINENTLSLVYISFGSNCFFFFEYLPAESEYNNVIHVI